MQVVCQGGNLLKGLHVAYFTASVDVPDYNKKFAESLNCDYPILSDADKSVARAYGVVHEGRAVPERWTFDIDKVGSSGPSTRRWSPRRPPPTSPRSSKSWESPASEWIEDRRQAEPLWCGGAAPRLCRRSRHCEAPSRCNLCKRAQRYFNSPRIFQKSRLCIRPGTRPHDRAENEKGSVYSR